MKDIIRKAILECPGKSLDAHVENIEARLKEAGYGKLDPYILSFLDQLHHGLKYTAGDLGKITEMVGLLNLGKYKCEKMLELLDRAKGHYSKPGVKP